MFITKDQLNRKIETPFPPKRIVSLVPSQTELLADLGLEKEVVGITKFCVHPDSWFKSKARVGGTKNLHLDKIRSLQPDLIIGNKEENDKSQLEILMKEFPVWMSDVNTLPDALNMIRSLGEITGKKEKGFEIAREITTRFEHLSAYAKASVSDGHSLLQRHTDKPSCAYFIWRNPWMVAGNNTFIHEMMQCCGLQNCFAHLSRYPEITLNQLQTVNCELLLLSSEPFLFKEKHAAEIRESFPEAKILFVDGEMFSWYGSRLLKVPAYFAQLRDQIAMGFDY